MIWIRTRKLKIVDLKLAIKRQNNTKTTQKGGYLSLVDGQIRASNRKIYLLQRKIDKIDDKLSKK